MGWTYTYKAPSTTPRQYLETNCLTWSSLSEDAHPRVVGYSNNGRVHAFAVRFPAAYFVESKREPFAGYAPALDGSITTALIFLVNQERSPSDGYNFGYKDIDESCGPYEAIKSAAFLSLLSPLTDPTSYAAQWRDRCREAMQQSAKRAAIKPGVVVKLAEPLRFTDGAELAEFRAEKIAQRGRSQLVFRSLANGGLYRISAANLAGAAIG